MRKSSQLIVTVTVPLLKIFSQWCSLLSVFLIIKVCLSVIWSSGQAVRWSGGQEVRWSGGLVVRWSASRFNNVLSLDSKLCSSSRSLRRSSCVGPDTKRRSCDREIHMSSGKHLERPMMSQCDRRGLYESQPVFLWQCVTDEVMFFCPSCLYLNCL